LGGLSPQKPPVATGLPRYYKTAETTRCYPTLKTTAELNNFVYYDAKVTFRILVNIIHTAAGHIDNPE